MPGLKCARTRTQASTTCSVSSTMRTSPTPWRASSPRPKVSPRVLILVSPFLPLTPGALLVTMFVSCFEHQSPSKSSMNQWLLASFAKESRSPNTRTLSLYNIHYLHQVQPLFFFVPILSVACTVRLSGVAQPVRSKCMPLRSPATPKTNDIFPTASESTQ